MKKTVIIGLIIVFGIFGIFLIKNSKNKVPESQNQPNQVVQGDQDAKNDDQMILFYGEKCPHCKVVEQYMDEKQIDSKLGVERKEVWSSKENQELLGKKVEICKLDTNSIGVPFLWTGSGCLMGDQPIIDFFNQKLQENQ